MNCLSISDARPISVLIATCPLMLKWARSTAEHSGVHGLMQVRGFTGMTPPFCTPGQMPERSTSLSFSLNFLRSFGFNEISAWSATGEGFGDPELAGCRSSPGSLTEAGRTALRLIKVRLRSNRFEIKDALGVNGSSRRSV